MRQIERGFYIFTVRSSRGRIWRIFGAPRCRWRSIRLPAAPRERTWPGAHNPFVQAQIVENALTRPAVAGRPAEGGQVAQRPVGEVEPELRRLGVWPVPQVDKEKLPMRNSTSSMALKSPQGLGVRSRRIWLMVASICSSQRSIMGK
jgi:hypothetical protein